MAVEDSAKLVSQELLKQKLQLEKTRLLKELEQLHTGYTQDAGGFASKSGGYGNHIADDASETFEKEKGLALEKNLGRLLAQVEHALVKFDLGTYERCDGCAGEIPLERLEALPHANLCFACKERQEKNGNKRLHYR